KDDEGALVGLTLQVYPMFGESYNVPVEKGVGGHGGGDPVLLEDIFGNPDPDPFNRAASHVDGAMSILTGICANKSIATGMPINLKDEIDLRKLGK
ncbi:MAG: gfo/Idh/MocA family oxidoreductase, partial [Lachnospiraceae bacterium]|nr:gfo/Idh/MocA family oxidoreductase [Lachnospiraceae bacterium]